MSSAGLGGTEGEPLSPVELGSGSLPLWEGPGQPEWGLRWAAWALWGRDVAVGWGFLFFPEQRSNFELIFPRTTKSTQTTAAQILSPPVVEPIGKGLPYFISIFFF